MLKLSRVFILIGITIIAPVKIYPQHSVSIYEVRWAVFHPFAAIKIKCQLPKAMLVYKEVRGARLLDSLESGGKLDAFRHTYAMAYLSRNIRVRKLRKLGLAHERGNKKQFKKHQLEEGERADSLACEMDIRNNELGFLLGSAHKTLNDEQLKVLTLNAIQEGKAWYLKRNSYFVYVTCLGEPINLSLYKQKWYVPKCLIKTNE